MNGPFVVSLDVGSSSVRALLFDAEARQVEGYGAQFSYQPETTPDGGVEMNPDTLASLTIDCLDELYRQVQFAGLPIAAVAGSAFWHSFLGVDAAGHPTLPILHLLDTRAASEVAHVPDAHARTGCVAHPSYWPAKLLWLKKNRPSEFAATRRWLSFPEYLFEKLFGQGGASVSMASGSGLWNQNLNDYDLDTLAALPIDRAQLAAPESMDQPQRVLVAKYRSMWPAFAGAPWFPALGDGACNNLGSGCLTPARFALMVGTTGAMRVVVEEDHIDIPRDLWCYRVDRRRFVAGGALSNGGNVYAWLKRTLILPADCEARLEAASPGDHGLTILPFLMGERSPYWRADLRGVITGLSQSTEPFDILRAALESVALRFRAIYRLLAPSFGAPAEVVASGGALLHSPAWTQMMADALGRPVRACTEPEASCRGAALWALERTGAIENMNALPASSGAVFSPRPDYEPVYDRLLAQQTEVYGKLFES
jgi:gluconokinase